MKQADFENLKDGDVILFMDDIFLIKNSKTYNTLWAYNVKESTHNKKSLSLQTLKKGNLKNIKYLIAINKEKENELKKYLKEIRKQKNALEQEIKTIKVLTLSNKNTGLFQNFFSTYKKKVKELDALLDAYGTKKISCDVFNLTF